MPNWSDLLNEFRDRPNDSKSTWLNGRLDEQLTRISDRRGRNVIVYASGFLQNPAVPSFATSINREDINGLMCAAHGLDFKKGLSLVIHTPGGDMASTETMIEYLRSKFDYVENYRTSLRNVRRYHDRAELEQDCHGQAEPTGTDRCAVAAI